MIFFRLSASLFLGLLALQQTASACTTFNSPFPGEARVASNFDWNRRLDVRAALVENPPNLKKVGVVFGAPITPAFWVSRFGSVSFTVYGAEQPVFGINEKGLVIGALQFVGGALPDASDPRPALTGAQFVQFNLDTSETIEDVIASNEFLRPFSATVVPHFLACDRSGRCAVFQYVAGQLEIYKDSDLPLEVLTNSPYGESLAAAANCTDASCEAANNSLWRFAKAALLRGQMSAGLPYPAQAFSALDAVAQFESSPAKTFFQMLFDGAESRIEIRKRGGEMGFLRLDVTNLSCRNPRRVIPIELTSAGDLSSSWQTLTRETQESLVSSMGFPAFVTEAYSRYPFESIVCLE